MPFYQQYPIMINTQRCLYLVSTIMNVRLQKLTRNTILLIVVLLFTHPIYSQNNCLHFDGVDDYVTCGAINPTNFTLEAWVYAANNNADQAIISTLDETGLTGSELHLGLNGSVSFTIRSSSSNWVDLGSPESLIVTNEWVHIAVTYNGSSMKIFVNGSEVASETESDFIAGVSSLTIGQRSSGLLNYTGLIDNVRMWSRALTEVEIQNQMYATLTGSETDLQASYSFNQGTAGDNNTAVTTSTNATGSNDGTLTNFTLTGAISNWITSTYTKPEPTNHATSFNASINSENIKLDWIDATGRDLPENYVIMASSTNSFTAPVDGADIINDANLDDGIAIIKLAHSTQTYSLFTNATIGISYYFRIYACANSGLAINYKTNATIPSTSVYVPKPEPTNHVTTFVASLNNGGIELNWTDANGAHLPDGYVIMASKINSFTAPVDGVELITDNDLSNGSGVITVLQGTETYSNWINAAIDTTYHFHIYAFSNSGAYIDYKTTATTPLASVTIPLFSYSDVSINLGGVHAIAWGDFNNNETFDAAMLKSSTSTQLLINNGSLSIAEPASFASLNFGSVSWGDYNNDNYLDLFLTGSKELHHTDVFSGLYKNNKDGTFSLASINFPQLYNGATAFADYDKDGYMDILIAGQTPTSEYITKIYHNNGNNTFSPRNEYILEGIRGSTTHEAKVIWADLNNDNNLDLILNSETKAYVYLHSNTSQLFEIQDTIYETERYDGYAFIDAGDYNNDGFLDIIRTGNNWNGGFAMVYKNTGNGSFAIADTLFKDSFYPNSAAWIDYDNNGFLDIIIDGKIYKNNNGASFSFYKEIFTEETGSSLVDIDNDGDIDIVSKDAVYKNNTLNRLPTLTAPSELSSASNLQNTTLSWNKTSALNIRYAIRLGTAPNACDLVSPQALTNGKRLTPEYQYLLSDTAFTTDNLNPGPYYWSVQKVNQNGIGSTFATEQIFEIDTVQASYITSKFVSNSSLQLKWERGNGNGCVVFAKQTTNDTAIPNQGTIYKGIPTLGLGTQIKTNDIGTDWYCIYNGIADSVTVDGLNTNSIYSFEVMEYYSENDSDFYCRTADSHNLITVGTSNFTERTDISLTGINSASLSWADYDNDYDLDLLMTGQYDDGSRMWGTTQLHENKGNQLFTEQSTTIFNQDTPLKWADIDGDNDIDLLVYRSSNATTTLYTNNSGILTDSISFNSSGAVNCYDINNDGWLEIIIGEHIYRNYVDSIATSPITIGLAIGASLNFADYNNDGFIDIVTSSSNPSKLLLNKGNFTFDEQIGSIFENFSNATIAWADYNNDGLQDFIVSDDSKTTRLFKNKGDNTFEDQNYTFINNAAANYFIWFDYNNDGNLDLLVNSYITDSYSTDLYENNNDYSFTNTKIPFPKVTNGAAAYGDYDNDGDNDLILCGETTQQYQITKIYQNNLLGSGGTLHNTAPIAIQGLQSSNSPGKTKLKWNLASDIETPSKALTYNIKAWNIDSTNYTIAFHSDSLIGHNYLAEDGNVQHNTTYEFYNLAPGKYNWQVQAIDGGFIGGEWSDTAQFTVSSAQAFFTADTVCKGQITHFTDHSGSYSGISDWQWNFGDTTSFSNLQHATHVYQYPGNHTVQLVVTNSIGEKDTIELVISVKPTPEVAFSANDVCTGTTTTITNETPIDGIENWNWNFGDAQNSNYANPSSHQYDALGTYKIKLTATANNQCVATDSQTIVITSTPDVNLTLEYGDPSFCMGDSVIYSVPQNTNYNYEWQRNGDRVNDKSSLTVKNTSGAYKVIVTNNLAITCWAESVEKTITAKLAPSTPVIEELESASFCSNDSLLLSTPEMNDVTYEWLLNGGGVQNGTNYETYIKSGGEYTIRVTNSFGCKKASTAQTIIRNLSPELPSVSYGKSEFCEGDSITFSVTNNTINNYQWINGVSEIDNATSNELTAKQSGHYKLEVSNANGCYVETPLVTVTVNPSPITPTLDALVSTTFCSNDSLLLSASEISNVTYQWLLNNGDVQYANNFETYAKQSGGYALKVINNYGCEKTSASQSLIRNNSPELPSVNYGETEFCEGENVTFSVLNNIEKSYQWLYESGYINNATNNTYEAIKSGEYKLKVSNANGCFIVTNPVQVIVHKLPTPPTIIAETNTTICRGDTVLLTVAATEGLNYQWSGGQNPDSANSYRATTSGTYSIKVADGNKCTATANNEITITVNEKPEKPQVVNSLGTTNSVCSNNVLTLSTEYNDSYRYQWYNQNGFIASQTATDLTIEESNAYFVKVTNENNCSTNSSLTQITVNPTPEIPRIKANADTIFCQGDSVILSIDSIYNSSKWYKNGTDLAVDNLQYQANESGDYTVKVSNEFGCEAYSQNTLNVEVLPKPETPIINYIGDTTFCNGNNLKLNITPQNNISYQWFNNNNAFGTDTNAVIVTESGIYKLALLNTKGCASDTSHEVLITVNPLPLKPEIIASNETTICNGELLVFSINTVSNENYQWFYGTNTYGEENSNAITIEKSGDYKVQASLGDCSSISDVLSATVNPLPDSINLGFNSEHREFCDGETLMITAGGNPLSYDYRWLDEDNSFITGANTNIFEASETGAYKVQVTIPSSGCNLVSDLTSVIINPNPIKPIVTVNGPTVFCDGFSTVLENNQNNVDYMWHNANDAQFNMTGSSVTIKTSGNYYLEVTNSFSCKNESDREEIIVHSAPEKLNPYAEGLTQFCEGNSVLLKTNYNTIINPDYQFQWKNESGNVLNAVSNDYLATQTGDFWLEVTNNKGCVINTNTISVIADALPNDPIIVEQNDNTLFCPGTYIKLMVENASSNYHYQWRRNGDAINGAIGPIYGEELDAGDYSVKLTSGTCIALSDVLTLIEKQAPDKPDIYAMGPNIWKVACNVTDATGYQWYYDDELIPNANEYSYIAYQDLGDYYVEINDGGECWTKSDIINLPTGDITSGILGVDVNDVTIFPNPSKGIFSMHQNTQIIGTSFVTITSIMGTPIAKYEYSITEKITFDLSNIPAGTYFCKYENNRNVIMKKIVKE